MTFRTAIDNYIADMRSDGRINSDRSADSYRASLDRFADQIGNRDPRTIGRDDIKTFLRNFPNANTQRKHRSYLMSFFRWTMWEQIRKDNPVEQTRPPKVPKPTVFKMTLEETLGFLKAARSKRERQLAFLGVCAGLRRAELLGIQGRHFRRTGWIWVSKDIAKGGKERWIPVMPDLVSIVEDIAATRGDDEYVFCARQNSDPGINEHFLEYRKIPAGPQTLWRMVRKIGRRASVPSPVTPHTMRHAFADHIARLAGVRAAQIMLGHASISTTEGYLSIPTLDELAASVGGVTFGLDGLPAAETPANPVMETVGIEPTLPAHGTAEPDPADDDPDLAAFYAGLDPTIGVYIDHFLAGATT